ncbi:MAG TPA: hypothetical protein PKV83_02090 [Methanothrix sp.]|nr:hypothetical protein [Methanothrix sp.]
MVNFEKPSYADIIIRFRQLKPMQQSAVVGLIFFIINSLYYILILHMGPAEAASISVYSSIVFMVVYYFTTIFVVKKNMHAGSSKGPKKGLRNK